MNYTLIGMPASGKSTIGVILAKKLGYDFIDCDIIIQKQTGKKLSSLISELGHAGFIELEDKINSTINVHNSVISTGGSAVYGENAMKHFLSIGEVIYLKTSLATIKNRIPNLDKRGVVHKNNQSLEDIFKERSLLYEKYATIVVDLDNQSLDKCIDIVYETTIQGVSDGKKR